MNCFAPHFGMVSRFTPYFLPVSGGLDVDLPENQAVGRPKLLELVGWCLLFGPQHQCQYSMCAGESYTCLAVNKASLVPKGHPELQW